MSSSDFLWFPTKSGCAYSLSLNPQHRQVKGSRRTHADVPEDVFQKLLQDLGICAHNEHSAVLTKEGVFYLLVCKGASMKLLHHFKCLELWYSGKKYYFVGYS